MTMAMDAHHELLVLAGRAPDGWLAVARDALAAGDMARLDELRQALDGQPQQSSAHHFIPQLRGHEQADRAVVGVVSGIPGTQACWATMRNGRQRLYLVQADGQADLPAIAQAAQQVLVSPMDSPRVEVFAPDSALPPYHESALRASDLLWSREPPPPIRVARTFDGSQPSGPWFNPHRELVVDPAQHAAMVQFLESGDVVLLAENRLPDVIAGHRDAVPADLYSDGRWVWSAATTYYLKRYQLAPEPDLAAHALANPPRGPLSPLDRFHVYSALSRHDHRPPDPGRNGESPSGNSARAASPPAKGKSSRW